MVDKKVYFVLLGILAVFFVSMFLLFGVNNIRQDNYASTVIIDEDTLWSYSGRNWLDISSVHVSDEYNWQKYMVYVDNEELGIYSMWKDDKWYVFDENKNAIPVNGRLFAYSANYKMKVYNFLEEPTTDMTYVHYVLKENGFDEESELTSNYHVTFDFDNDKVDEDFYIVSNAFPLDFNPDNSFSFAFMVKDNEVYPFYQNIKKGNSLDICKPYFHTIVDTNNDGIYELVLSCGNYSTNGTVNML